MEEYVIETWADEEKTLMQSFMYVKGDVYEKMARRAQLNPHCTKMQSIVELSGDNYKQIYPTIKKGKITTVMKNKINKSVTYE